MRKAIVVLVILTLVASLQVANAAPAWKMYDAGAFTVKYPVGWKVQPIKDDGVNFASPDGVVFYALGGGQFYDAGLKYSYQLHPATEIKVSEELNGFPHTAHLRIVSIRARDGSYYRRFVETINAVGELKVFGFKYPSLATFEKHKSQFAKFQATIVLVYAGP